MDDSSSISSVPMSPQKKREMILMLLSMFTITISQFAAIVASVYSEDDSESDRRRKRKLEHEALPFMQNKARVFGAPQLPLESTEGRDLCTASNCMNNTEEITSSLSQRGLW